jgi:hypothetical protein
MTIVRGTVIGAAVLLATTLAARAQAAPYPAYGYYPPYPYYSAPAAPPSWSYNPYTSGLAACTNWSPGDSPCRERMQPSFGQPNYGPVR